MATVPTDNQMKFWLSKSTGDRFQFPVNPSEFNVTNPMGYEDVEVIGLGETTKFGEPGQREVSFSGFLPRDYLPGLSSYTPKPGETGYSMANKLINWMRNKTVLTLTITHTNVVFPVTIREFNYSEKGGEPGDVYFDITLKEYRSTNFRIINPNGTTPGTRPGDNTTPFPGGKYTVKKGDTLWDISKKFYGTSTLWKTIYNANIKVIGNNPHRIYPGQVLVIPKR